MCDRPQFLRYREAQPTTGEFGVDTRNALVLPGQPGDFANEMKDPPARSEIAA
jgi:hypothetical protein